ncbi:MAG: cell division protein [Bdellovibrionales bacterium RIFCSPHIGHO2_01_FULL_40_29]|nr:MAG: cell division protein [Bdellovibrionales bacterium RIFCSPHIGHO2_01_FULL_40_29]OFZ34023.1 MAG: cell division protein [Bdellovibrionales bacterium RIFCSPHIGHO2_02_FULL_40_15]
MKSKIITLFAITCCLWSILLARAAYLQFLPQDRLNALQERQFQTVVTLPSRRGAIIDTHRKELAMTSPAYSVYADPKIIESKKTVARKLSKIINQSSVSIFSKIKKSNKRFIWLERLVSASVAEEIRQLNIRGIGLVEEWKRVYPNDQLLSSTLGFVGKEGQALEGLELHYDSILKGEKKKVTMRKDARGRPLVQDGLLFTETPQGKEIKLTIDSDLQYFVESELNETIKKYEADGAWAVVLDAKTSAIRALASLPHFDPNAPASASAFVRRNRAVTDTFEPGSTLKTFVIAEALERSLVKPATKIYCEDGAFKIGKRIIREAEKDHAQGTISVTEVLAYSSNIGTSKIALMLGDQKLKQGLNNFGFGERSGVDLPGEAKGITVPLPWRDHLLANVSFGQGITVTPLQMANAYATLANGGILNQPYIVESIADLETNEVQIHEPRPIRRVISESTAEQMREMLVAVTSDKATGTLARVSGFSVGGKTGTAQKVKTTGRGYMPGGYIASFAGFIPAQNPEYVIFIGVDRPRKGYYGSQVVAPVFSKIASYAVRKNGITPDIPLEHPQKTLAKAALAQAIAKISEAEKAMPISHEELLDENSILTAAPKLKALTVREVLSRASEQQIQVKFVGTGRVESTWPAEGEALGADRNMTVYLKE